MMTNNRRILTSIALCAVASIGFLTGCSTDDAVAAYNPTLPPPGIQAYGVDGKLNENDLRSLFYLQFPQSYSAMQQRFGFPMYRTETDDFYQIEGTSHWIAIQYSGRTALSYRVSDSQ